MLKYRVIVQRWNSPQSLNSITVWYFSLFKWSKCGNYHNIRKMLHFNLRKKCRLMISARFSGTDSPMYGNSLCIYPKKTPSWICFKSFFISGEESLFLLLSNRVRLHSFIFLVILSFFPEILSGFVCQAFRLCPQWAREPGRMGPCRMLSKGRETSSGYFTSWMGLQQPSMPLPLWTIISSSRCRSQGPGLWNLSPGAEELEVEAKHSE